MMLLEMAVGCIAGGVLGLMVMASVLLNAKERP